MIKSIIAKGPTIDDCLAAASEKLECSTSDLSYEVIEQGKKGLFKSSSFKLRIRIRELSDEDEEEPAISESEIQKLFSEIDSMEFSSNGCCELSRTRDSFLLKVTPPQGFGKKVSFASAMAFLEQQGVFDVDEKAVTSAVEDALGQPIAVARLDPDLCKDGEASISISSDCMKVEMILTPPVGGGPVTLEHVVELSKKCGVQVQLNMESIEEAIERKIYGKLILIAQGTPPIDGKNAYLKYHFLPKQDKLAPKVRDDGGVDFRSLDLFDNVPKGGILAQKVEATKGTDGITVTGTSLPAKAGEDIELTCGPNTELSEDGKSIVSQIDGQVSFTCGTLSVHPVLVIDGDVDFSVGNIDFVGNVIVRGSILDNFSINCSGDLEVADTIEAAEVKAGGDVVVKGGVLGRDKGTIRCEGTLFARFIENCACESKHDVIVEKAIMHSRVRARKILVIDEQDGLIVGGEMHASEEVRASQVGVELATKTTLILGNSREIQTCLSNTASEMQRAQTSIGKADTVLDMLLRHKKRNEAREEYETRINKARSVISMLNTKIVLLEEERTQLEKQLEYAKSGMVHVKKAIFPGVTIIIATGVMKIRDVHQYAIFYHDEGLIKFKSYEANSKSKELK